MPVLRMDAQFRSLCCSWDASGVTARVGHTLLGLKASALNVAVSMITTNILIDRWLIILITKGHRARKEVDWTPIIYIMTGSRIVGDTIWMLDRLGITSSSIGVIILTIVTFPIFVNN